MLSKVSLLLRGRITRFSTDRLIRFLNVLHGDVEIHIRFSGFSVSVAN